MAKSKYRFAYRTDIRIPNLDAMTVEQLEKFAARTGHAAERQSGAKADWLQAAASYARHKLAAMRARASGDERRALRNEVACANVYFYRIPKRMKWR